LAANRSGDRGRSVLTAANSRFLSVRFGGPFGQGGCAPFPLAAEVNATLREGVPDGVEWVACIVSGGRPAIAEAGERLENAPYRILRLAFRSADGEVVRFDGTLNDRGPFLADSAV